jgi:hypothetical protein
MTDELNLLTEAIIGAALEVHRELGPGLLVDCGYRLDLVVDGRIVVEVKAVERLNVNAGWLTEDGLKRIVNKLPD